MGGIGNLAIDATDITPDGLVEIAYEPLYQRLKQDYHVIPFGFDWRQSIVRSAQLLAEAVKKVIAPRDKGKQGRTVRIIAHSMGGLVARTFVAQNPELWQTMKAWSGRLIMLGTPNYGSYVPAQVFLQQHQLIWLLAKVDLRNSLEELTQVVRAYPGLLEMLPLRGDINLFKPDIWEKIKGYAPNSSALQAAKEFRSMLDAKAIDPEGMIYVAGRAKQTPASFSITGSKAHFKYTSRGDGTVPWDLGLLERVPTYYVDAEHGTIPSHQPSLEGFLELLDTGRTGKLATVPPVIKRDISEELEEFKPEPSENEFRYYPDANDLVVTFAGRWTSESQPQRPISLSVVNADIRDAEFPVIVGHYRGDPIVSVEAVLDRLQNHKLSRDMQLGRYPAAIGTARIYTGVSPGVLVIGLGEPGKLSRSELEEAFRAALVEYALACIPDPEKEPVKLKVCSLLVGTYGGGRISVEDSVSALSDAALRVNQDLDAQSRIRIDAIEIFELFHDIAVEAAHAIRRLQERKPVRLVARSTIDHRASARESRPSSPYQSGWNRRIRIHTVHGKIQYEFTTDLARNLPFERDVQWNLVDLLLSSSSRKGREITSTLFQYLLPHEVIHQTENLPDVVIDLNPESARIPWELLRALDESEENREPVAAKVSILRTLSTVTRRENPRRSSERRALVIGEPAGVTPPLPGALAEAKTVEQLLKTRSIEVTSALKSPPLEILDMLYAHDYDIIHVAAHGEFNDEISDPTSSGNSGKSGVVMADGCYLRSHEFANLRAVPSIVFLNCCHLGKIDGDLGELHLRQPGRFSASLAEHLVEMGVGVVIVAGWAVSDAPAKVFAETLYSELLDGENLSAAVRQARHRTYQNCPSSDVTWGAFQVYGDPGFVLHWAERRGQGRAPLKVNFVSASELCDQILNCGSRGRGAKEKEKELLVEPTFRRLIVLLRYFI